MFYRMKKFYHEHSGIGVPVASEDSSNSDPSTTSISLSGLMILGPTNHLNKKKLTFESTLKFFFFYL